MARHRLGYTGLLAAGSTSDGRGFVFSSYKTGCFSPVPASGVLRTRVDVCGISRNVLLLTDTVLWGTDFCAID